MVTDSHRDWNYQIVMKDLSKFSQIYLVPLADLHLGADVALDVFQGYVNWIAEHANAFSILNGDLMNCATKDTASELFEDLITPDDAYKQVRSLLEPIKNKILMITRGNHEEHIWRTAGHDYMAQLAYDLGDIPYKPDGGMLGLRLALGKAGKSSSTFFVYATHGWGGARTLGAKVKKAQDLMLVADADCYVLSHDHTQNVTRLNLLTPGGSNSSRSYKKGSYLITKRKLFVNTGGFVKYTGYIQRRGLMPQDLGTPRIRMEFKGKYMGQTKSKTGKTRNIILCEKDLHCSI